MCSIDKDEIVEILNGVKGDVVEIPKEVSPSPSRMPRKSWGTFPAFSLVVPYFFEVFPGPKTSRFGRCAPKLEKVQGRFFSYSAANKGYFQRLHN